MRTFSKPSFTHSSEKLPPGGGLPDFTRRGTNYLHIPLLKKYPESESLDSNGMFFGFNATKIGGVLMKTFFKPSFTHFPQKWPPGGGGLADFTTRGANYLHTNLVKESPRSKSLEYDGMCFGISAPKIGGVLMKTVSKPSFTHFFQKMAPRGGGYQISPAVALTTCIHLYSKSTQRASLWTLLACSLDSTPPK